MTKQILILFAACLTAFATYATAPTITSYSPASGSVGTLVTITGTNLSSPTAFTIGGVSAIAVSNTGSILVGMVMPGAATGTVSVTTSGGTDTGSVHFPITPTPYPHTQQGPKLVGTGAINGSTGAYQGYSVSLSADGNTAIVGAIYDTYEAGAAWVYTRSGTTWTQQGGKLVGTGANNARGAQQGQSVALSADGNTAIVGGSNDYNSAGGAVWVYTRSGATWTQQGLKLIGTGAGATAAEQGYSVSLSADGNTAIVGGPHDNSLAGAAWVFTRSGTTWTQQGSKLVGTGATGNSQQGTSVSLSADGNTAIVGGALDSNEAGAAWVFTRSGTTWTQQGLKLVGTGATDTSWQGTSVSLSADGNTAIVGGPYDNSLAGAAWVYTRSGGVWTQQGSKLVGTGAIGTGAINGSRGAQQGQSVSLSADGNTAIVGGFLDDSLIGAAWVYTRSGTTWTQQGHKLVGTGAGPYFSYQGFSVALSADGNTAIEAGWSDNNYVGAAWVFASCASSYDTINHSICRGDTFTIGSKHHTTSNTYIDTLTNVVGCDSIVTLHLTVNPLPVVTLNWQALMQAGDLIIFGDTAWCGGPPFVFAMKGGLPVGGAYSGRHITNDTFDIVGGLIYKIDTVTYTFIDSNRCVNKAVDSFYIDICEGIPNISRAGLVNLYPNPNTGTFTLQTSLMQNATYTISDMLGQIIQQEAITSDSQTIDIGAVPTGIYMLSITGTSGIVKFAVMR